MTSTAGRKTIGDPAEPERRCAATTRHAPHWHDVGKLSYWCDGWQPFTEAERAELLCIHRTTAAAGRLTPQDRDRLADLLGGAA